jgi:hypothetical protein
MPKQDCKPIGSIVLSNWVLGHRKWDEMAHKGLWWAQKGGFEVANASGLISTRQTGIAFSEGNVYLSGKITGGFNGVETSWGRWMINKGPVMYKTA